MTATEVLQYVVKKIHTTVVATVDDAGLPVTAAIDMMDADDRGLYFLTAKGKGFYDRLTRRGFLALTGMRGADTLHCVAVSLRGQVRELGAAALPKLLEKNPYIYEIYPTEASRQALTVFQLYAGSGEWFDLSKKPIERFSFSFGEPPAAKPERYHITTACTGCAACGAVCPQNCIDLTVTPAVIAQTHCLHCGNCQTACPVGAVERSAQ